MDLDFWPVPARDRHLFFLIDYYYIYSAIRRSSQKKHDDIPAHPASLYLFSLYRRVSRFSLLYHSRLHICRLPPFVQPPLVRCGSHPAGTGESRRWT